ncbi:hypothetical protein GDO86_004942 [Hymenochirus boettgeri]|uniref:Sarcospan n=1 Tax=Hymenochirus boettgeri TaxID=247094 RepID=A0A8T2J459_9PIPI|nr:hypothetical protein GDO86_004942 [Hymenochirus boettgeri]
MGGREKGKKDGEKAQSPSPSSGKKEEKGSQDEVHTCCRFPLLVALLQLALGVSVTVLSFIMVWSCSSLLLRDTPYWAGISVIAIAVLGLFLLCLPYVPDEKTLCQFALKLLYFLLSVLGLIISILAVAFASYHYSIITKFTCHMVTDSCECTLDSLDPLSRSFQYRDVTDCTAVTVTIKLYVLLQVALNLLLGLVCLAACFVMWKDRYQIFYVGLWFHLPAKNVSQQPKV